MAIKTAGQKTSLEIRRTFAAPRERVFRAWTEPEELKKWASPPGYETPEAEVELRVGGRHRIGMRELPDGEVFYNSGVYREVKAPERLVYTWAWEGAEEHPGETLVTVDFLDRGDETEVVLTHELFPNAEERDKHEAGWNGCLEGLAAIL